MWPDSFTAGARGGPPIKRTLEIPDVVRHKDLLKEVKSAADVVSLQSNLNRLDAWSKESGLTILTRQNARLSEYPGN